KGTRKGPILFGRGLPEQRVCVRMTVGGGLEQRGFLQRVPPRWLGARLEQDADQRGIPGRSGLDERGPLLRPQLVEIRAGADQAPDLRLIAFQNGLVEGAGHAKASMDLTTRSARGRGGRTGTGGRSGGPLA